MSTQFPLKSALFAAFLVFFSFPLFAQYTLNGVCSNFTIKGTLVSGDSIQQGRTSRDGLTSICGNGPKACVFFSTTGSRYYDTHTVTNPTESSLCVNVRLSAACPDNPVYLAIYSGRFNPADLCQNYLSNSSDSHEVGPMTFSFTLPARQTAVLVPHMVNTATACAEGYTIDVWIEAISAPAITITENSGTPNDGIICSGTTATLTANGGQPYRWSTGATTQSITVNAAGAYTVTVNNGSSCARTITSNITVQGSTLPPTISVTENSGVPNDGIICEGTEAVLTATGTPPYRWSTGATTGTITVNTSGTYTVTVGSNQACLSTATSNIFITRATTPSTIIVTENSGVPNDGTLCGYGWASLRANGPPPFQWSNGATTESITVSSSGIYTVTVGDGTGCSSTAITSISNELFNRPTIKIAENSGIPDDGIICDGSTATLTIDGDPPYLWSTGATTWRITVNTGGTYTVTVSNGSRCSTTLTSTISLAKNTVPPIIKVTENSGVPNDGIICAGNKATLTANDGPPYLWNTGATTQSINIDVAGTYTVTVNNHTSCSNTATRIIVLENTFAPPPSISITGNSGMITEGFICENRSVILTANGNPPYQWSTGETTAAITVNALGSYTVTVSNGQRCSSTATRIISALPPPILIIENSGWDANDGIICEGQSATLTASGGSTYKWSTGEITSSISVKTSNTYTVTVTSADSCTGTRTTTINVLPGVTPKSMLCNDIDAVAIDEDCRILVTPYYIMSTISNCISEEYIVERKSGNAWIPAEITGDDVNRPVSVRVRHVPTDTKCEVTLRIVDRIAPKITRCADLTVSCALEDYRPDYLSSTLCLADAIPTSTDNCSSVTRRWSDVWRDFDCRNMQDISIITRTWEFADASGNRSRCEQKIYIKRSKFDEIILPEDITVSCTAKNQKSWPVPSVELGNCTSPFKTPLYNSSLNKTSRHTCSLGIDVKDETSNVCNGKLKIIRWWKVIDWCLPLGRTTIPVPAAYRAQLGEFYNNPFEYTQEITVTDTEGPTFPQLSDLTVSTDKDTCCATVDMPDVVLLDSCSRITSTRMSITLGETGTVLNFQGILATFQGNNLKNPDTLARFGIVPCLPVGNHRVTYTAVDDCGNQSSATFMLRIQKGNCPEPPGGPQPLVSGNVPLRFDGKTGFELYPNAPNPWDDKTVIGFQLPEASPATLTVYDQTGRILFRQKGDFGKGYNAITIARAQLNYNGAMFYKLETPTNSVTKKMTQLGW